MQGGRVAADLEKLPRLFKELPSEGEGEGAGEGEGEGEG